MWRNRPASTRCDSGSALAIGQRLHRFHHRQAGFEQDQQALVELQQRKCHCAPAEERPAARRSAHREHGAALLLDTLPGFARVGCIDRECNQLHAPHGLHGVLHGSAPYAGRITSW